MALESVSFVEDLVVTNPPDSDTVGEGNEHLKIIKVALKNTFPGMSGRFNRVQYKTVNYTIVGTDNNTLLVCISPLTLTLTTGVTLGNGHTVLVYNNINTTIDIISASPTELINGFPTYRLWPKSFAIIVSDGLNNAYALSGSSDTHDFVNPFINSDMRYWGRGITSTATAGNLITRVPVAEGARLYASGISTQVISFRATATALITVHPVRPNYALKLKSTIVKTGATAADEFCYIGFSIEGFNVRPIAQVPFNLSFFVRSSVTGIYHVAISNAEHSISNNSFVKSFNISAQNTWELKHFKIPPSNSGPEWIYSATLGMLVKLVTLSGSNFITTDNDWTNVASFTLASTAGANFHGAVSASLRITGLNIWRGDEFKHWAPEDMTVAMKRINRYFYKTVEDDDTPSSVSATVGADYFKTAHLEQATDLGGWSTQLIFPVRMRIAPAISIFDPVIAGSNRIRGAGGTASMSVSINPALVSDRCAFLANQNAASASNAGVTFGFNYSLDARL